jgi:TolB-like protein/Tfp pilus assembly protein PilF
MLDCKAFGGPPHMQESEQTARVLQFGVFEVDLRSGELYKHGLKIKLQDKPFQVLVTLLERPGNVVTREELRKKLWADDTFVDFEHSINIALNKLRAALGDSAQNPRFIETLSRHGYRFLAPVKQRFQASLPSGKIMLAVLPFDDLSNDPGQDYFSEGLTEEMITQLGRMQPRRLGVIARSTAMRFKGTDKQANQIGQELGVSYILEGSVRRTPDRVRITAQLIQVSDQTQLWAETYDRKPADVLDIQREVSKRIAKSLTVELIPDQQSALSRASTRDSEAHEAYLKGRYFWNKRSEEEMKKAIAYFEQAIARDSSYALAYTGLCDCYETLALYGGFPPGVAAARSRVAATKALEIDDNLAEAHSSLAFANLLFDWDWPGAEREFKRALDLNPNCVTGHHWYGLFLALMGRFEEAFVQMKHSLDLDPLSLVLSSHVGWFLYYAHRFEQAIGQLQKTLEIDPQFPVAIYFLGLNFLQKGRTDEAIAEFRTAEQLSGGHPAALAGLARAYGQAGQKTEGQQFLDRLGALAKTRYVSPYLVASAWMGLGDKSQAIDYLEKAFQERSGWMPHLKVDPVFDDLRTDARFENLLQRVGLPP